MVLAVLASMLAGCRIDVMADLVVDADGSGTVGMVFHLDEALLDELDTVGVDPTAELEAAALADDTWTLVRGGDERELTLTLTRDVTGPSGFGDALRELTSGLAADDPALLVDVEVEVDDDGASRVTGEVSFRSPATAGIDVDGEPLGPDPGQLQAIVERSVSPALVVTMPGEVTEHDADELEGRTLRWDVPVGAERSITARAEPVAWWHEHLAWVGATAAALLLGALLVWWVRRRRR